MGREILKNDGLLRKRVDRILAELRSEGCDIGRYKVRSIMNRRDLTCRLKNHDVIKSLLTAYAPGLWLPIY